MTTSSTPRFARGFADRGGGLPVRFHRDDARRAARGRLEADRARCRQRDRVRGRPRSRPARIEKSDSLTRPGVGRTFVPFRRAQLAAVERPARNARTHLISHHPRTAPARSDRPPARATSRRRATRTESSKTGRFHRRASGRGRPAARRPAPGHRATRPTSVSICVLPTR